MKKYTIIILFLFLIPLIYGLEECQREEEPRDMPCNFVTGWDPTNACITYNLSVFNETGELLYIQVMDEVGSTGRCNATFNITTPGQYYANSTVDSWNVLVRREDNMTSLGIMMFLILLNVALFIAPFKIRFSEYELSNELWKKGLWLTGLAILTFNTTIFITLADNFGLGITSELFVFQWLFIKGLYVAMILLFWNIMITTPKIWKVTNDRKRMGEDE